MIFSTTFHHRARAAASTVVASLLGAVSPPALERLAGFALEWLSGRDGRLRRAACQVRSCQLQGSVTQVLVVGMLTVDTSSFMCGARDLSHAVVCRACLYHWDSMASWVRLWHAWDQHATRCFEQLTAQPYLFVYASACTVIQAVITGDAV